jgi:hypothetical protein
MKSEEFVRISFFDYSDFDPSLCRNGGKYGDETRYVAVGEGKYRMEFHSTADDTCPMCGNKLRGVCCDEYRFVSEEFVAEQIRDFVPAFGHWIEVEDESANVQRYGSLEYVEA